METTYGTLDPPLGKVRLRIAYLICAAVSTNTKLINNSIAQTGILGSLLVRNNNCLMCSLMIFFW